MENSMENAIAYHSVSCFYIALLLSLQSATPQAQFFCRLPRQIALYSCAASPEACNFLDFYSLKSAGP